jgi:hypothetical protein
MPEAKKIYTLEQQREANEAFKLRIGRAVAMWSYVESGLCVWFQKLTQMHPVVARRIFYSVSGFDPRKRMLKAALGAVHTDLTDYLTAIINKAGAYSSTRNMFVHGDVLFVAADISPFFGQTIILQGRQAWTADTPDSEVLTSDQMEITEENFGRLAAIVHYGLGWDGFTKPSPLEFLELIQELPNPAHKNRLAKSILERAPHVPDQNVPFHR